MCSRLPRHKTAKKKPSTLTLENASHFLAKVLRSFRHADSKSRCFAAFVMQTRKTLRVFLVTGLRPIPKKEALKPPACKHARFQTSFLVHDSAYAYIIPPMPPAGIAGAGTSSLISATADSVVRKVDATEVAFCRALLVTLTGSRMPADTISTYLSFRAS